MGKMKRLAAEVRWIHSDHDDVDDDDDDDDDVFSTNSMFSKLLLFLYGRVEGTSGLWLFDLFFFLTEGDNSVGNPHRVHPKRQVGDINQMNF